MSSGRRSPWLSPKALADLLSQNLIACSFVVCSALTSLNVRRSILQTSDASNIAAHGNVCHTALEILLSVLFLHRSRFLRNMTNGTGATRPNFQFVCKRSLHYFANEISNYSWFAALACEICEIEKFKKIKSLVCNQRRCFPSNAVN